MRKRTVAAAVRSDLQWLEAAGALPGREAIAQLALRLALEVDRPRVAPCPHCAELVPTADPSALGLLAVRLTALMLRLPTTRASDKLEAFLADLSAPVRDPAQP